MLYDHEFQGPCVLFVGLVSAISRACKTALMGPCQDITQGLSTETSSFTPTQMAAERSHPQVF